MDGHRGPSQTEKRMIRVADSDLDKAWRLVAGRCSVSASGVVTHTDGHLRSVMERGLSVGFHHSSAGSTIDRRAGAGRAARGGIVCPVDDGIADSLLG